MDLILCNIKHIRRYVGQEVDAGYSKGSLFPRLGFLYHALCSRTFRIADCRKADLNHDNTTSVHVHSSEMAASFTFGSGMRVPKHYSGCSCCFVVVISSLKIPKASLNTQRSATKLCIYTHLSCHSPQIYRLRFLN